MSQQPLVKFVLEPYSNRGTFSRPMEMEEMEKFCQTQQIGGIVHVCHLLPFSKTNIQVDWNQGRENLNKVEIDDSSPVKTEDIGSVSETNAKILNGSMRAEDIGSVVSHSKRGRGRPRKHLSESRDLS